MNTQSELTRTATRPRPLTDAEYAARCQCACRRLPRRPHTAFECAHTTGTGATS
jgi:hypothetical protein